MNRVRIAAVAAGLTVAMVVGVLVGGALSTANADGETLRPPVTVDIVRPYPADAGMSGVPDWVVDAWAERFGGGESAARGAAEPEVVQCSIVDGCTVELVDGDGEVVKVMHITFTDAGVVDVDEAEASE